MKNYHSLGLLFSSFPFPINRLSISLRRPLFSLAFFFREETRGLDLSFLFFVFVKEEISPLRNSIITDSTVHYKFIIVPINETS